MTSLDSILKSWDITLLTKVHEVKAMVFPVVMYGCDSWTIKKAERQRIDAFELWCWRRLLRVPWTTRRSNQSILKEISPKYSLEVLMLKLKLQYFGHLDAKSWLIWKDPDAGKDWRQEEKGMTEVEMIGWHHQLDRHEFGRAPGVGDGQGDLARCSPWGHKELGTTEWQNWTEDYGIQSHHFMANEFSSDAQSCPTLCDPTDCSTPGFPVHYQLTELAQTHVHQVGDAIQPSHPLSSPSPAFNLSQHQGFFRGVSSWQQVPKVL